MRAITGAPVVRNVASQHAIPLDFSPTWSGGRIVF